MRMKTFSRSSVMAVAALAAAIAAALIGGAGSGRAATSFSVQLTPLIGTTDTNAIPQVSFGGNIGYHLHVVNTDTSNTTHVQVLVTTDTGAFLDASDPSCVKGKTANVMVCTPFGGTMVAGAIYDVDLRFVAPASGSSVSATGSVSIAAQSVGGKQNGNNGTTVATGNTVVTNLVPGGSTTDTFLRNNENASANGAQTFGVTIPGSLIGSPFGLALGIQNQLDQTPICASCLNKSTTLTIPAASLVTKPGNPFYVNDSGSETFNPFGWSMTATYSGGFQLHGVWHIDDSGNGEFIPSCASLGGAPTAAEPLCWLTLNQNNSKKTLTATGLGLENGRGSFG